MGGRGMITGKYLLHLIEWQGPQFIKVRYKKDREFRREVIELKKHILDILPKLKMYEIREMTLNEEEFKEKEKLLRVNLNIISIEEKDNKVKITYKRFNKVHAYLLSLYPKVLKWIEAIER